MGKLSGPEQELVALMGQVSADPYGFVLASFPWGEPGELEDHEGPHEWQRELLDDVGSGLKTVAGAIQEAVSSGHGVGKSSLVAWLILWAMATHEDTRGVVTANTESQLRTKTWPELSKWYRLFIAKHWFNLTATSLYSVDPDHEKTWRIDAIPWSEKNTEAFAGLHNQGKRILVIFDEASAIPDIIWETTEGALTDADTQIIWGVFGNPTRNTGRFRECFGRFRHRWTTFRVDSRTVPIPNKKQIEQWITDYGEDSDFIRVRVKGEFPRASSTQFVPIDVVEAAMSKDRDADVGVYDPLVMGVDVARYGDDETIIRLRRGRDARSLPEIRLRGKDTMFVAARVAELHAEFHPDAIFIDGGGVGAGVVDRCRALHLPVIEVQFGAKADRSQAAQEGELVYANKRAEMWGSMRDWLRGGMLNDDPDLLADITGVEYGYVLREGRDAILLEAKADMKKRGLASPDRADALALTFAYPVAQTDHRRLLENRPAQMTDYDPYASSWAAGRQQQTSRTPNAWMPGRGRM